MRTSALSIAVILLVALPLVGCSKGSPEANLVGTWAIDAEATLDNSSEEMSDEEREMASAMLGAMEMTVTFNEDGTAAMTMSMPMADAEETESGIYEVVSVDGDVLTVKMTNEDEEEKEFTITFHGSDTIAMAEGGEVVYFSRQ